MNAIILYENFDLATSARDMLSKAAHRADGELRWTIKPWRLDVLRLQVQVLSDAPVSH